VVRAWPCTIRPPRGPVAANAGVSGAASSAAETPAPSKTALPAACCKTILKRLTIAQRAAGRAASKPLPALANTRPRPALLLAPAMDGGDGRQAGLSQLPNDPAALECQLTCPRATCRILFCNMPWCWCLGPSSPPGPRPPRPRRRAAKSWPPPTTSADSSSGRAPRKPAGAGADPSENAQRSSEWSCRSDQRQRETRRILPAGINVG
jgi:hypothetical protein